MRRGGFAEDVTTIFPGQIFRFRFLRLNHINKASTPWLVVRKSTGIIQIWSYNSGSSVIKAVWQVKAIRHLTLFRGQLKNWIRVLSGTDGHLCFIFKSNTKFCFIGKCIRSYMNCIFDFWSHFLLSFLIWYHAIAQMYVKYHSNWTDICMIASINSLRNTIQIFDFWSHFGVTWQHYR